MNLTSKDLAQGTLHERSKIGSSLADVDPMSVDKSVSICELTFLNKKIFVYLCARVDQVVMNRLMVTLETIPFFYHENKSITILLTI